MGDRPTHFQIGTIIITLGLPIESHNRTSSSRLLRIFLLLSFREGPTSLGWVRKTNIKVMLSRYDNRFPIWSDLVISDHSRTWWTDGRTDTAWRHDVRHPVCLCACVYAKDAKDNQGQLNAWLYFVVLVHFNVVVSAVRSPRKRQLTQARRATGPTSWFRLPV